MGHHHAHSHLNSKAATRSGLLRALVISSGFMWTEAIGGYLTNSLALMADAGHMLTDVAALGLGLFAAWISARPATPEKTYGYFRVEILAALVNGVGLVVIALLILFHAYRRFLEPPEVAAIPMLTIAVLGLLANLLCVRILGGLDTGNLNVRGALLHVFADALGSFGAVLAGIAMFWWRWYLADPLISFLVAMLILFSSWKLLRDSVDILLESTPAHIDVVSLERELTNVPGVTSIHDLHVWSITSGMLSMSCHVVVEGSRNRHDLLCQLNALLRARFSIHHSTIQLEESSLEHEEPNNCR